MARTCDLLIANETLYQLSYDPIHVSRGQLRQKKRFLQLRSEISEVKSPADLGSFGVPPSGGQAA